MRTLTKLRLAGLTAALVLAVAVSAASANRLSFSTNDYLLIFPRVSIDNGSSVIYCRLTLLGSLHSTTITKSLGSLIGQIFDASVDFCEGDGDATVLTETLPWHLTYQGFYEELPAIEGINFLLIGVSISASDGIPCLLTTKVGEPGGAAATVNPSTGRLEAFVLDPAYQIDLEDDSFLCDLAGDGALEGGASLTAKDGEPVFVALV